MKNPNINWTKVYKVNHDQGNFNIYITSHKSDYFLGAVLYYDKDDGNWSEGTIPTLNFKLEQFIGKTENETFQQCDSWLFENFKGKGSCTINLDRTIT